MYRLRQYSHNLLKMSDLICTENTPLAVFQPLLANLVAANLRRPRRQRHILKKLRCVYPDAAHYLITSAWNIAYPLNAVIAWHGITCDKLFFTFHQVRTNQLFAHAA